MRVALPITPAAFGDDPPEVLALDRQRGGAWSNVLYARVAERTLEFDAEPGDRLRVAGVVLGPEVEGPNGEPTRGMLIGDWLDLGVVGDAER